MEKKIYSVTELTRTIKNLLETHLPSLWLEGEVSNYKRHYSQHLYFTLKDANAQIAAVMWRSRAVRLPFEPEDGMHLRVLGNVRVYEQGGRYQIDILQAEPAGVGSLQIAFEQLKARLHAEGLFDDSHKKPLPLFPKRIALVTSPTGAAIRDMLNILSRRAPYVDIFILPVAVQGENAAASIADAIEMCNRHRCADVIITGRGGGSLEDLWAFNEERVARAVFKSRIPVISAVGHETDFTITDFVADLRAPTPSAAAELVVTDKEEWLARLSGQAGRLMQAMRHLLQYKNDQLNRLSESHVMQRWQDRLNQNRQRLDLTHTRLSGAMNQRLLRENNRLQLLERTLRATHPDTLIKRGYSLTLKNGRVVTTVHALKEGDTVETRLADGRFTAQVATIKKDDHHA
ncbi:MAG: exodeoxyribonuclease VII large subunit [Calditrichaeota bacterium]|nr:MAG: exodeoxyribonuclease VII large subunit [Calditrichota bacterium]